jgi:hypothetical protein
MNTRYTEKQILSLMTVYDGGDAQAVDTITGLFKSSNQTLEEFVLEMDNAKQWNTGGGCMVSALFLDNNKVFICSDEVATIYKSEDSFWEQEDSLECWWIESSK